MGLSARTSKTWRTRSRAGIALVVLTAWFGTLLVAAPTASRASAAVPSSAVASPSFVNPPTAGTTDPTFDFTLPGDDPASGVAYSARCAVLAQGDPDPAPDDTTTWQPCTSPWPATWPGDTAADALVETVQTTTTATVPPDTATSTIDTVAYSSPARTTYTRSAAPVPPATPTVTWDSAAPALANPGTDFGFTVGGFDATTDTTTCGYGADPAAAAAALAPCSTPYRPFGTAPTGAYVLVVKATRTTPSGTATDSANLLVQLDADKPTVSISVQPPVSPDQPKWVVTSDPDVTSLLCSVAGVQPVPAACGAVFGVTLPGQGSYTLTVAATDAAGNTISATSSPYVWDVTAPSPPTLGGTVGAQNTGTIRWTVDASADPDTDHVVCEVFHDGSPVSTDAACGTAVNLDLADTQTGVWRLDATAVDAVGNRSTTLSRSVTFDRQPPVLTVNRSLAGPSRQPTWTMSLDEPGSISCMLAPSTTPVTCGPSVTYDLTARNGGSYRFTVTATDLAGNAAVPYVEDYVIAPVAPTVTVAATGADRNPAWSITADPGATLSCQLLPPSGSPIPVPSCADGVTPRLSGADGVWNLQVVATSPTSTGTVASAPGTSAAGYLLDTAGPGTPTITGTPAGSQNTRLLDWSVSAAAPQADTARIVCSVSYTPAGTATAVPQPDVTRCDLDGVHLNLTDAQQGDWQITATAYDALDNASPVVVGPVVTFDRSAPAAPTVTRTSASPTKTGTTAWTLATTETAGATFLCSWTGPGFSSVEQACPSSYSFGLPTPTPTNNGDYVLSVVVLDAAGNRGTPTTGTVVLDGTAPAVTFTSAPAVRGSATSVSWGFAFDEAVVRSECQLVKRTPSGDALGGWSTCASGDPQLLGGGDGTYLLEVRGTDAAGNTTAPAADSDPIELDTTAPGPPGLTGPSGWGSSRDVSWTVTPPAGAETPAAYYCRLVKDNAVAAAPWTPCGPPSYDATLTGTDATYRLDAVSADDLDNRSAAISSSADYFFDPTAPTAAVFAGTDSTGNATSHTWTWQAGETNLTATCRLYTVAGLVRTLVNTTSNCGSSDTEALASSTAGTTYVLQVTLTDRALNSTAVDGPSYLLDTVAPAAPTGIVGSVTGTANTRSATYTFSADPGTVYCRLVFAPVGSAAAPSPIPGAGFARCTSGVPVRFDAGDGNYQLQLHVQDAAGNVGPDALSAVYTLDTTGPLPVTFTAEPTGTRNVKVVSWTWTGENPSTGLCTLSRTPVGSTVASVVATTPCNGFTYATTLTYGDGVYQLAVQLTDPYDNAGAVAVSAAYTLDATAPAAPGVDGPTGTSNKTSADYSLTTPVEAGATAECQLTRDGAVVQAWASCTLPRTVPLGADGSYVLSVRLTDQYGNQGLAGASPAYLLDTVLPAVPVVTAPPSPASSAAPQFTFTTDADTTTTCRVTRSSVVVVDTTPCRASYTAPLTGMPDGDYVVTVTATDPAGNVATGTSGAYTFDTTKPTAPVVTGLPGPSQTRNPAFSWTGEVGAKPECSLQEKAGSPTAWGACSTPYAPALPADGTWVLSVRLTDAAGNVSDAGASGAYILDTTAPTAPVVTSPTSPGRDLAPSWSASTEEGSKTECRLTGPGQLGAWGACTLPMTTPISGDGDYTFEVRATDAAGNVSLPGAGSYLLDTTAPGAPAVSSPTSPGRTRAPSFSFTAEAGTTGSCRLTRGTTILSDSAACGSPSTVDLTGLPDGAYTLSVRAVDPAGNIGPAGTATYVLDTTAPVAPTYTLIAGSPSSDRAPVFGFNTETGATVGCKLTMPSGAVKDLTCASPLTLDLSNATDGDYVLAVRATDPAGNVSPAATATYHFDSGAPAAPKVVGPPTPGSIRNPLWRISSTAPAECRLTRSGAVVKDWTPCGTSYAADLYAQPDGAYVLEARVIGTTAATTSRYRLDTAGPAAATIVGPPSPSTVRKPTWAVASPDTTATAECRVLVFTGVLRDWTACGVSPAGSLFSFDLTGLGDGTYTLAVRLTDGAGNVGPTATDDYVLDTSAPAAVGVVAPLSPGNDTTPTWTLTSAAGVKLECRVSSGQKVVSDFAPCSGTFTADLTGLPDGTYTLTVHALSAAGTPGPETTSGYILDTTAAGAPGTLSGPTGPSRDRAPKWTFTLAPGTTATCKVTVGGKVFRDGACTSPFVLDLSNAADGTYTLTVRAVDAAGNLGSPSTAGYILKTSPPPAPVLTMQPGSPSSTTDPRWGFSLFRGTTGQCRLLQSGAALEDWTPCTSPTTALLSGKPDGSYTMQVRAIDVAGNTSPAVGGDYVFDRSAAPLAIFVDTPASPGNDLSPSWRVVAPDAAPAAPTPTAALLRAAALTGAPQVECRLTTPRGVGSWAPCGGTYTAATNGDGTYLLEARAYDAAGERGPASSSTYVLDTRTPAAPRFTDPLPPSIGNDPEVPWSWADDENLVECRLLRDGRAVSAFAACDPPYVAAVGRLGEATYAIEARAIDAAGNVSPVATASYRYDITPPPAPVFASRPAARGTAGTATWTFGVPLDANAVCIARRNGTVVAEGACAGSYALDLRGQQPATWALSVHFVDAAGNVGPSTVGSYTLTSAVARGRVDQPFSGGGAPGAGPTASGPRPAPGPAVTPPLRKPDGGVVADHPHVTGLAKLPDAIKKGAGDLVRGLPAIPGAIPGTDVPKAIKNVLGQTITKPQLPLALFVIVLLFLLVQNQIDRRDPKLAAAPVTAEPELTFGPTLRPGGATA